MIPYRTFGEPICVDPKFGFQLDSTAIYSYSKMGRKLISSGSTFEKEIGYSRAVVVGEMVLSREQQGMIIPLWKYQTM